MGEMSTILGTPRLSTMMTLGQLEVENYFFSLAPEGSASAWLGTRYLAD